jgi:hypothetical protein
MALALSARPVEKLRVSTLFELEQQEGAQKLEPALEYAFAEWKFSEALRVRAGRVKLPFGIYTEILDVGTLRPFFTLPQGVYGPTGTVVPGYNGIGLTGRWSHGGTWALQYDVYGGGHLPGIQRYGGRRPEDRDHERHARREDHRRDHDRGLVLGSVRL